MKSSFFTKLGLIASCIAVFSLVLTSCNREYDLPSTLNNSLAQQGINATMSIADLKTLVGGSGAFRQITDSIVIKGVVSGNDKSGNLYKELYIQDTSGAISIMLDATGLYTTYPVGREIAVLCKGLWLTNQNNMKKLSQRQVVNGAASAVGIPSSAITSYVRKGALNQPVEVKNVTIAQLNNDLLGMLVQLDNFEVISSELRNTYSDPSPAKIDQNTTVRNCTGDQIIFRTSAYASFAGTRLPQGNGSLIAIYTIYNSTKQLLVRDTADVQFRGIRCDGSVPGTPDTVMTLAEVRSLGEGGTVPGRRVVDGVITSNTLNEAAGNYIIQDESGAAMQLRFSSSANRNYNLGDSVNVDISGITITRFNNGALQLSTINAPAYLLGSGTATARVTTVPEIFSNFSSWESSVVTLTNVTIVQGSTNSTGTNYTITDGTGNSITTFIRHTLGVSLPANAAAITGYVGVFSGAPQLNLRSASDVRL